MRKVIYTDFIPGVETCEWKEYQQILRGPKGEPISIKAPMQFIVGTNCTVEKEGRFHGIFQAYETPDGRPLPSPMALIEEYDGSLRQIHPSKIRFVDSPETEQLAEFAKAAMQGLMTSGLFADMIISKTEYVSQWSVAYAKSLIAELNKHEPIESTGYTIPYLRIEQEQAYERMRDLGINIHAQTFEQCVNDLLYRLENPNSPDRA